MNQFELNRAVARATGETVSTVKRLGFLLADIDAPDQWLDRPAANIQVIDWDQLARRRHTAEEEAANRDFISP